MKKILLVVVALACGAPCAFAQKTSQLPAASSIGDTNIVNITQGSPGSYTSNGATLLQLKNYVLTGALTPSSSLNGANITNGTIPAAALTFSLATVATSGSYNDLLNKPTIPAAQVNSDWKAGSGLPQILNRPYAGTQSIPVDGSTDVITVSGLGLSFTPSYVFVTVRKSGSTGYNLFATVRGSTISSAGFTADLSSYVPAGDTNTYNLDYLIVP